MQNTASAKKLSYKKFPSIVNLLDPPLVNITEGMTLRNHS